MRYREVRWCCCCRRDNATGRREYATPTRRTCTFKGFRDYQVPGDESSVVALGSDPLIDTDAKIWRAQAFTAAGCITREPANIDKLPRVARCFTGRGNEKAREAGACLALAPGLSGSRAIFLASLRTLNMATRHDWKLATHSQPDSRVEKGGKATRRVCARISGTAKPHQAVETFLS